MTYSQMHKFIQDGVNKKLFQRASGIDHEVIICTHNDELRIELCEYKGKVIITFYTLKKSNLHIYNLSEFIELCPPDAQEFLLFNLDLLT